MTAAEWEVSTDPARMLAYLLTGRADERAGANYPLSPCPVRPTDRQLRLFAVGVCRRPEVWERLVDDTPCDNVYQATRARCKGGLLYTGMDGMKTIPCGRCHGTGRVNRSRRAVEVAELFADGLATEEEVDQSSISYLEPPASKRQWARAAVGVIHDPQDFLPSVDYSRRAGVPPAVQADLLRCIFGNPWKPVTLPALTVCRQCGQSTDDSPKMKYCSRGGDPDGKNDHRYEKVCPWVTPAVVAFARDIYDGRRFEDLPVLADMLEADGCPIDEPCPVNYGKGHHKAPAYWSGPPWACEVCDGTGRVPNRLLAHLRSGGPHCRGCHALDLIRGAPEAAGVTQ